MAPRSTSALLCAALCALLLGCLVSGESTNCYRERDQSDYRGTVHRAYTGNGFKTCLPWTDEMGNLMHSESFLKETMAREEFEDLSSVGVGPHNYCRNPQRDPSGAWCQTGNDINDWGYCPEVVDEKCDDVREPISGPGRYVIFELTTPDAAKGFYEVLLTPDFGAPFEGEYKDAKLVMTRPDIACTPIKNVKGVKGNFALIKRGDCTFVQKARMAEAAGAIGVIIYDHHLFDATYLFMLDDGTAMGNPINIPAFGMLGRDGRKITQALQDAKRMKAIINIPTELPNSITDNHPNEEGVGTGSCQVQTAGVLHKICGVPGSSDGSCGCDCLSASRGFACKDFYDMCGGEFCAGCPASCTAHSVHGDMRGNGWCDPECNNERCGFDGGDCCEHTCHYAPEPSRCGEKGYACDNTGYCPQHCSLHGKCLDDTKCECDEGYTDYDCSQAICENPICVNGDCVEPDQCHCFEGWGGPTCEIAHCPKGCRHGTCTQPGVCECEEGYHGETCDEAKCDEVPCQNGQCIQKDACHCFDGWGGKACDIPHCLTGCVHGNCFAPETCKCDTGYSGARCNITDCPSDCKHGSCLRPNVCTCTKGWFGIYCDHTSLLPGDPGYAATKKHATDNNPSSDSSSLSWIPYVCVAVAVVAIVVAFIVYRYRKNKKSPTTVITVEPPNPQAGVPGRMLSERRTTTTTVNGRRTVVTEERLYDNLESGGDISLSDLGKGDTKSEAALAKEREAAQGGYNTYEQPGGLPPTYSAPWETFGDEEVGGADPDLPSYRAIAGAVGGPAAGSGTGGEESESAA